MNRLPVALFAALLVGCAHSHSPHNAPGNVDLFERPEQPQKNPRLLPFDPGEQAWSTVVGPSGGLVLRPAKEGDPREAKGSVGGEVSLFYSRSSHSHSEDPAPVYFGQWHAGLNLGMLAVSRSEGWGPRAYTEVQYGYQGGAAGVAAGWQTGFGRGHGPQLTFNIGPLYMRTATSLGLGTEVELGLLFKGPVHTWVSSL